MNNLMNFEGHEVEIFKINGQILFNPNNVGECLGIKNIRNNLSNMNEKQVVKLTNSKVGITDFRKLHNTGENFLTESGVYKLIFESRKPEAERFQDWVTDEILLAIRKEGSYIVESNQKFLRENLKEVIREIVEETIVRGIVKETIRQVVPDIMSSLEKAEIKKKDVKLRNRIEVLLYSESYTYSEISKILKKEGYNVSPQVISYYADNIEF